MKTNTLHNNSALLEQLSGQERQLAVLIDPDTELEQIRKTLMYVNRAQVNYIFVGGSLMYKGNVESTIKLVKQHTELPVVLFPGSEMQLSDQADALLFISLLSGRNPSLLIGKHVEVAPFIAQMNLEVLPTGYLLIDGGKITSASYMSQTLPIPSDKPGIAVATALAGKYLGLKIMYLDAGSGAINPVSAEMIQAVKHHTQLPVIVGGGITNSQGVYDAWSAGANVVVVGNRLEQNPEALLSL